MSETDDKFVVGEDDLLIYRDGQWVRLSEIEDAPQEPEPR